MRFRLVEDLNESLFFNEQDIFYNKDKFDSGEINLCFVTGLSGSGKTTMTSEIENDSNTEVIHLDDLQTIKDNFSMDNLKKYGDLIYSFFINYPQYIIYLGMNLKTIIYHKVNMKIFYLLIL